MAEIGQSQFQNQIQKQQQSLSHLQIQALNLLSMGTDELKDYIYKEVSQNPALEIVKKKSQNSQADEEYSSHFSSAASQTYQQTLEATEDRSETLQSHLMLQLNSMPLSQDEHELSEKLIYNLDDNGFYGSMLAPETLLNKKRPLQNKEMLEHCIARIQKMDPVGTCCKSPEESLFVQAKLTKNCPKIALFILDGHIDLLNPPQAEKVYKKLCDYQTEWHKKKFAPEILLDKIKYDSYDVDDAINFILHLNLHPAQGYTKDTNSQFESPDIVLKIEKVPGYLQNDDYSRGLVSGNQNYHFQVKYASGVLPELKISKAYSFDKTILQRAQDLLENLAFRESTIVLQGCSIVKFQKDFFLNGDNHLTALTRKTVAADLGIHESTVSRMSAKKGSKYLQTEWGLFPASYFFQSGVAAFDGSKKVSAQVIKQKIQQILASHKDENLSDFKLTQELNAQGIKIARRTVAKYRSQSGISNSYHR